MENVSDPYWKRALTLFNGLSAEQQEVFFEVIRQIAVDTTSNVLGVIDGVNALDRAEDQFVLTCESGAELSGDLQSLFLAEDEQASRK
jgi:hypothetical protein